MVNKWKNHQSASTLSPYRKVFKITQKSYRIRGLLHTESGFIQRGLSFVCLFFVSFLRHKVHYFAEKLCNGVDTMVLGHTNMEGRGSWRCLGPIMIGAIAMVADTGQLHHLLDLTVSLH